MEIPVGSGTNQQCREEREVRYVQNGMFAVQSMSVVCVFRRG